MLTVNEGTLCGALLGLLMLGDFIANIVIWPLVDRRAKARRDKAEANAATRVAEESVNSDKPEKSGSLI